jgi:hypothetical protein
MTAQTTTQRTAAHSRRMAERLARYEGALEAIYVETNDLKIADIASRALNPTIPTADAD